MLDLQFVKTKIEEQIAVVTLDNPPVNILTSAIMKEIDETFSQTVHSRFGYKFSDVVWGAKFTTIYHTFPNGQTTVDLAKLNDFEKVELPVAIEA